MRAWARLRPRVLPWVAQLAMRVAALVEELRRLRARGCTLPPPARCGALVRVRARVRARARAREG